MVTKLTMRTVQAFRADLGDDSYFDVGLALCDEWIEAHQARWDANGDLRVGASLKFFGFVGKASDRWVAVVGPATTGAASEGFNLEAEARTWLEEQARKAGYEVV
jgi:hypothetical protein